eukprot:g2468.t1
MSLHFLLLPLLLSLHLQSAAITPPSCAAGRFISGDLCLECPSGKYKESAGDGDCTLCTTSCGAGKELVGKCTSDSNAECWNCAAGKFKIEKNSSNACLSCTSTCPVGKELIDNCTLTDDNECWPCENGHYKAEEGDGACTLCTSMCPIGEELIGDCTRSSSPECLPCETGRYKATEGNERCKECITSCPAGEELIGDCTASSTPLCLRCKTGEYKAIFEGVERCQKCITSCPNGQSLVGKCTPIQSPTCKCTSEFCNNNGIVSTNLDSSCSCTCKVGFTGSRCELETKLSCPIDKVNPVSSVCDCGGTECSKFCYPDDTTLQPKCQDTGKKSDLCVDLEETNPLLTDCQCGSSLCSAKKYCFLAKVGGVDSLTCSEIPRCLASEQNAITTAACLCGNEHCPSQSYCYDDICQAAPKLPACTILDGFGALQAKCQCGSAICPANNFCYVKKAGQIVECSTVPRCTGYPTVQEEKDCFCDGHDTVCKNGSYCYDKSCQKLPKLPECTIMDGIEALPTACICGGNSVCSANSYCYNQQCETTPKFESCKVVDGINALTSSCLCGKTVCEAKSYCHGQVCKETPKCIENESTAITETCQCGKSVCEADSYCYDQVCQQSAKLQMCFAIDGSSTVPIACLCGSNRCEANNYCFMAKTSKTDTLLCSPVPRCRMSVQNQEDCLCNTVECKKGSFCIASSSDPLAFSCQESSMATATGTAAETNAATNEIEKAEEKEEEEEILSKEKENVCIPGVYLTSSGKCVSCPSGWYKPESGPGPCTKCGVCPPGYIVYTECTVLKNATCIKGDTNGATANSNFTSNLLENQYKNFPTPSYKGADTHVDNLVEDSTGFSMYTIAIALFFLASLFYCFQRVCSRKRSFSLPFVGSGGGSGYGPISLHSQLPMSVRQSSSGGTPGNNSNFLQLFSGNSTVRKSRNAGIPSLRPVAASDVADGDGSLSLISTSERRRRDYRLEKLNQKR